MLKFEQDWNSEIQKYANKYGEYQAYLSSFDTKSIISAIWAAKGHFNDQWVKNLLDIATDIHDKRVVNIEQGTHQPEDTPNGGGFCLHFTGRDPDGYAFHFYITQKSDSQAFIFKITYKDGILKTSEYS